MNRFSYKFNSTLRHALCFAMGGSYHLHHEDAIDIDGDIYINSKWYWNHINGEKCSEKKNRALHNYLSGKYPTAEELPELIRDLKKLLPLVKIDDNFRRIDFSIPRVPRLCEPEAEKLEALITFLESKSPELDSLLGLEPDAWR